MENFNRAYELIKTDSYKYIRNSSLVELWNLSKETIGLSKTEEILEVGSGAGLTIDSKNITGIEISSSAIDLATDYVRSKLIHGDYLTYNFDKTFDVIFDSHLLHCLEGIENLKNYFQKSERLLNNGGVLIFEIMIKGRSFKPDPGFEYDELTGILTQSNKFQRTIVDSYTIENLVKACGLKIVYLRADENIKFIPYSHRSESLPTDPDRLRVICIKE